MLSKKTLIPILLAVFTLAGCANFCFETMNYLENRNVVFSGYEAEYSMDTAAILDALAQNDLDAFTLRSSPLNFPDVPPVKPIAWSQKDYFLIADRLNQKIHGETLEQWKLDRAIFQTERCADVTTGLEFGVLGFYKTVKTPDGERVYGITYRIYPRYNQIEYAEGVYAIIDWETFDWKRFTIPADAAFSIAENNGGKDFRESVNNDCKIHITLEKTFWKTQWQIKYWANPDKVFLVDTQNGSVNIGK